MKRSAFFSILCAISLLFALAGCQSQTVTPADKAAFLTVSDLRAFGYANPKPPAGKWSKTGYGDGTYDMDYEIDTAESELTWPLYLSETLSDEKNSKDALAYLATTRGAQNLIFKSQKMIETAMPNQTIYGDGSSLTVLRDGKTAVGNIFSARKKGRTFSLIISGFVFEDPKEWDDFAGKKINAWLDGAK